MDYTRAKKEKGKTTTAGFEPARAKPNRFLVCLLNHSDKLSRNLPPQSTISEAAASKPYN